MRFVLEIDLGNEAMKEGSDVSGVLLKAADVLVHYDEHGLKPGLSSDIKDRNGNTVGRWRVKP